MTRLGLATIIAAVALVGLAGVALATTHGAGTTDSAIVRRQGIQMVTVIRNCAVALNRYNNAALANTPKGRRALWAEIGACMVIDHTHPFGYSDTVAPPLQAARRAGRQALDAALTVISDQENVQYDEAHPQVDPNEANATRFALQTLPDMNAFVTDATRFIRLVARVLHVTPPRL